MGKLFDENFCTDDYDQKMIDFINKNFGEVSVEWKPLEGYLKYGIGLDKFWTSDSHLHCSENILTKQQFKEKIGMIDKVEDQGGMVSYKLIDKEGYLAHFHYNECILNQVGCDIFRGIIDEDGHLLNEDIDTTSLIDPEEFQFFEKIDNNTPAGPITEPVAELDDELKMLPYQNLIDDCKELNINLVVTGEGLYILDCINSVEYKIEESDDYQKIVDAMRLLQNKEMD